MIKEPGSICRSEGAGAQLDLARAAMRVLLETNRRTDQNIRIARSVATTYEELARRLRPVAPCLRAFVLGNERCEIADLADVRREARRLADGIPAFAAAFEAFVAEHGALLDQPTIAELRQFAEWAAALPRLLEAVWQRLNDEFDAGLDAGAAEAAQTAADWDAVSGDGLSDEASCG